MGVYTVTGVLPPGPVGVPVTVYGVEAVPGTLVVYIPGGVLLVGGGVYTVTGVLPPGVLGVPVTVYGVEAVPGTEVV